MSVEQCGTYHMIEALISYEEIRRSSRHIWRSLPEANARFQSVTVLIYLGQNFNKKVEDAKLHSIRFRKILSGKNKRTLTK